MAELDLGDLHINNDDKNIPSAVQKYHIGIIPDGNRRWCTKNGVPVTALLEKLTNVATHSWAECKDLFPHLSLINAVSVYMLSKDNLFKRNDQTLDMIRQGLQMLVDGLENPNFRALMSEVKIQFVGELHLLPTDIRALCTTLSDFCTNDNFVITGAIGYDPLLDSLRLLQQSSSDAAEPPQTERPPQRDIDLVVRSGGELRSSGFFPLKTLYSEWFYLDTLWPDMTFEAVDECVAAFLTRNRRFGK